MRSLAPRRVNTRSIGLKRNEAHGTKQPIWDETPREGARRRGNGNTRKEFRREPTPTREKSTETDAESGAWLVCAT
jgi:hypothetical protein